MSDVILCDDVMKELDGLTPRQRNVVMRGLTAKLAAAKKTGRISYRYDVCPVCADVGSTEENPKCEMCYIPKSCKKPFDEGFKGDYDQDYRYFDAMLLYLSTQPSVLVVGGTWDEDGGKPSSIVGALSSSMSAHLLNGGTLEELKGLDTLLLSDYQLVIWMPNVKNDEEKYYPNKAVGSVLVCSKVMREGYTRVDSSKRIFAMRGNGVIEIRKTDGRYSFTLVDALSNEWAESEDIEAIGAGIFELDDWTRSSKRLRSTGSGIVDVLGVRDDAEAFLTIVHEVARNIEAGTEMRYFGNCSTRCMSLFPSMYAGGEDHVMTALVSPRNIDKRGIEVEDLILASLQGEAVRYLGDRKPSVDTAVQLAIYNAFPEVRYMIHGHAYIKGRPTTSEYFPCGDLRELADIMGLIEECEGFGAINLKNHGFLIFGPSKKHIAIIVNGAVFEDRLLKGVSDVQ